MLTALLVTLPVHVTVRREGDVVVRLVQQLFVRANPGADQRAARFETLKYRQEMSLTGPDPPSTVSLSTKDLVLLSPVKVTCLRIIIIKTRSFLSLCCAALFMSQKRKHRNCDRRTQTVSFHQFRCSFIPVSFVEHLQGVLHDTHNAGFRAQSRSSEHLSNVHC